MTDVTLVDFSEKIRRMCREYTDCGLCKNCPLYAYSCSPSDEAFLPNIDKIVSIVYEWDKEHPQSIYNVRFMKYFDIEVVADNENEAFLKAEHLSEDIDFNEADDDYDVWMTSN